MEGSMTNDEVYQEARSKVKDYFINTIGSLDNLPEFTKVATDKFPELQQEVAELRARVEAGDQDHQEQRRIIGRWEYQSKKLIRVTASNMLSSIEKFS